LRKRNLFNAVIVVVFFFWVFCGLNVVASLNSANAFQGSGTIKTINVGIYSDAACTSPLSSMNFGLLEPGASSTNIAYLKNTGDAQETVTMATGPWTPSTCPSYMTLHWNLTTAALQTFQAGQVKTVAFQLLVYSNVTGITNFSFTTTITGTG